MLIAEASAEYDSAAFEAISANRTLRDTGFGNDPDTAVRRVWDSSVRRWRYFTLGRRTGRIVERTSDGQKVGEWSAASEGEQASAVNPLDVTVDGRGRPWVSRGGAPQLLVLGGAPLKVDLSRFSATVSCTRPGRGCGNPSMAAVTYWGGAVFVALRRLRDGFDVETDALIVRVDTTTLEASELVVLSGVRNPGERFTLVSGPDGPTRTIEAIGGPLSAPPEKSAALVRVDLSNGSWKKLLDGRALNAFVVSHTLDDGGGFAILAEYDVDRVNPTRLVRFTSDGSIGREVLRTSNYGLWRVQRMGPEQIALSERSKSKFGISVLRRDGTNVGTINTILPPYDFEVHEND